MSDSDVMLGSRKQMISSDKLSIGEKVGYDLGDCAANFVFQTQLIFPGARLLASMSPRACFREPTRLF